MSIQGSHSHQGEAKGVPASFLAGFVPSFSTKAALKAFDCSSTPDDAVVTLQAGDLTLSYQKQTGADAESEPGTLRADDHATTSCIYYLKSAFINGFPAEYNSDTDKFHLTKASGDPVVVSGIDQTGVAFP